MSTAPEQMQKAEKNLRETAEAIVRLLSEDLAGYPERELRRRFVDSDAADQVSDAELGQLRREARELGAATVARIERELAWPGPWPLTVADLPATSDGKARHTLADLPLIWRSVAEVDGALESLAARYRLRSDDRQPAGYQPPARFIGHQHLPTLTEKLLKGLQEFGDLQGRMDAQHAENVRRQRAARWDAE